MIRPKCIAGYDPYDSAATRVWVYKLEGASFQWDDEMQFMNRRKAELNARYGDYVRQVSTRPVNPADWQALAPVANMNDPFDGLASDESARRKLS